MYPDPPRSALEKVVNALLGIILVGLIFWGVCQC